jgi:predicted DNA-binding transcriptional regulator AlpA
MNRSGVEPLAFSANDLAVLFSVSVRQIWSMHQAGSLGPSPLRLGARLSRWDRKEVEQWWYASKTVGRPISRNEWLRRQDVQGHDWHGSGHGELTT